MAGATKNPYGGSYEDTRSRTQDTPEAIERRWNKEGRG